jgi:hypothetical protein
MGARKMALESPESLLKRCNWCRKRLRRDYPLFICPDCCKRLAEMVTP